MRIAHVIWGLGIGGAETMLVDIVNEQVKSNDVLLIAINDLVNERLLSNIDEKCKAILLRRKIGSISALPWIRLNYQLLLFHPDIIHCHLEGFVKMILNPAPKVFTIHNITTSGSEYAYFKALYAISDAVKEHTYAQGFDSVTIHNGINPDKISVNSNVAPFQTCRIVSVGRLFNPHKGHDILINAAKELVERYGISNFHIDLIGDGPSRNELERLIDEYHLVDHVSLLGNKDRSYVYSHLKDYNLYVLPSRYEGFGLSVAEAVCAKIPVMVCDLDGPMEVINGGNYGYHFRSDDFADLADQLYSFIQKGADWEMIDKAYSYVRNSFDMKRVAHQYLEEYQHVIGK